MSDWEFSNFKEMDYYLRDAISIVKSQVDYLVLGGVQELSDAEKNEFYEKLLVNVEKLYETMNRNVVVKAKEMDRSVKEILRVRAELEHERNELKKRNRVIEQDLILARNIQRQIIPSPENDPDLGMFYKPMDQLGGDFFDIIHYRETDKIGFFISDVSGHGIPASLVTTMIKSVLMQMPQRRYSPSELFGSLNRLFQNIIAGNFITAFLGVLNRSNGELIFCNAGHPQPVIIRDGAVVRVRTTNDQIPIAVLSNEELKDQRRSYADDRVNLKPGDLLFLYTDGLSEAFPVDSEHSRNVQDFEEKLMKEVIPKYCNLEPKDFVQAVFDELKAFRMSDTFDDDICMLCYRHSPKKR